jgi:O-antigen ligase
MSRDGGPAAIGGEPRPFFGALGVVVFFSTFSIAGTQTALGAAAVLWAAFVLRGRLPAPRRTPLDLPILLFALACLISALASAEPVASLEGSKNLLLAGAIYLFAYGISTRAAGRRLFAVLLISGAASSLFGVAVFALGRGEGTLGRTPGTFSTAMTFGGITLVLSSLFAAVAAGAGIDRRARVAAGAAAVASLAALFFSFTRSSWLGMVVAGAVVLSLLRRRWLVPFAASLVLFAFLLPAPYRARVESIWNPAHRTNVQRVELARGGWSIFKEHPLLGVGTRDLAGLYREHMPPGTVHVHGHMHNIFLQVAVQTGVVGLAAFAYLLVSFFVLVAGNLKLDLPPPERAFAAGSLAALAGFVVNGLFEWNFGDAEVVTMIYVVVGANAALRRMHPLAHGGRRPSPPQ